MSTTQEQITDLIGGYTDLKDYFEQVRGEMQPFMAAVEHPNRVTLEVGAGKQFAHPVDACLHINNHVMSNNMAWRVVISSGIYGFPYKGHRGCHLHHGKQVELVGSTGKAADVIFEGRSEHHDWLLVGDHHCHLRVNHITFRDSRALTPSRVEAVEKRNYVNNNAGGIVHGVLVRYGSLLSIGHCQFDHLWHAIGLHDNSQAYIGQCAGNHIISGLWSSQSSFSNMVRCQWTGVGNPSESWRRGHGVAMRHGSVLHAHGNVIRNYQYGIVNHWHSDVHFHRAHGWGGSDGRTPVDIIDGLIENCHRGVSVWHNSGGNFSHLSIRNSRHIAFETGMGSSAHAHSNVTIDGASIGFYCRHNASIVANNAVVRNCSNTGFHAAQFGEIHAGGTKAHVSGNGADYSPSASHTLGNYSGQIYIS
jgi:hypothetical protein